MKIYEALAHAFNHLNLGTCFALLGDANMHWAGKLSDLGTRFVYTRHEHAAVAAATAYARNSKKIGFATVTCGPGLTQIMTIIPIAVRAKVPLVIFVGEAPIYKEWYNQKIDQAPFVEACGAEYVPLHNPQKILKDAFKAISRAAKECRPVVLGVPLDLQKREFEGDLEESIPNLHIGPKEALRPNEVEIDEAANWISSTEKSVIIAGLGATSKEAKAAIVELAEISGSLLATTLPAKGLFHDQAFCIGVAGGYSSDLAKEVFARSELVIGIGARMASHSFDGGKLTPNARVLQIDIAPNKYVQGRKASDFLIKADAELATEALISKVRSLPQKSWRSAAMKASTENALKVVLCKTPIDGFLHPLTVIEALQNSIPKRCHIINTSGHCAYYTAQMNHHPQTHYTVIRDFGAIGNGTSFAIGIAELHPDRPVILIDGDGSIMMHIQELETMVRHNLNILTVVLNDGAYGSEVHKLRALGASLDGAIFGRPDFAAIGRGFGLTGTTANNIDKIKSAVTNFLTNGGSAICDVHISDMIASPQIQSVKSSIGMSGAS